MQALIWRPGLAKLNLLKRRRSPTQLSLNPLAFSFRFRAFSSSLSDYTNQSRGGLPRFYSVSLPTSKGGVVRVEGDEFWHMTKVLRLSINDRVELFNGKGGLVEGCIQHIDHTGVDFVALENAKLVPPMATQWHVFAAFGEFLRAHLPPEPMRSVFLPCFQVRSSILFLMLGTLKGGRVDWLVEKCTELGASSVTPLLTERSPSISENRFDRLERVILAASKQCQRLHEMTLKPPLKIGGLQPLVAQSKLSFVAVAEATPVFSALSSLKKESTGLMIIGPEGDFTEAELRMTTEAGATAVGLGPHRLRVETATIAFLSTLMLWSLP